MIEDFWLRTFYVDEKNVKELSFISTVVWLKCNLQVPLVMLFAEHLISLWNFMVVLYLFFFFLYLGYLNFWENLE